MTTLKTIREAFPHFVKHEQEGSKQLFVCSNPADSRYPRQILVSYLTIVGFLSASGTWVLTRHSYSRTTSRQLAQFAKGERVIWQDTPINLSKDGSLIL